MLGLDKLDKILNKPAVEIDQAQCLNNRYRKAACTACIDACPAGALAYAPEGEEKGLRVDLEQCLACGVCQAVCPTHAFDLPGLAANTLLLKAKGKRTVEVACPKAESGNALQVPCLAAVDADLLLLMGLLGTEEVVLRDAACASCAYRAQDVIRPLPDVVRPAAEAFGMKLKVRCVSESPRSGLAQAPARAKTPAPEDRGESFSRRDLFTLFKRQAAEVTTVLTEDWIFANNARPQGLRHKVSGKRLKLLELARQRRSKAGERQSKVVAVSLPAGGFAGAPLRVDAQVCDGCGLCVAICPTGAISQKSTPEGLAMEERVSHCLDCGVCLQACPHQAIRRDEGIDADQWLDLNSRQLVTLPVTTCSTCGKTFIATPAWREAHLCLQCKTEQDMLASLFDAR